MPVTGPPWIRLPIVPSIRPRRYADLVPCRTSWSLSPRGCTFAADHTTTIHWPNRAVRGSEISSALLTVASGNAGRRGRAPTSPLRCLTSIYATDAPAFTLYYALNPAARTRRDQGGHADLLVRALTSFVACAPSLSNCPPTTPLPASRKFIPSQITNLIDGIRRASTRPQAISARTGESRLRQEIARWDVPWSAGGSQTYLIGARASLPQIRRPHALLTASISIRRLRQVTDRKGHSHRSHRASLLRD